jgi:hypothetical protein
MRFTSITSGLMTLWMVAACSDAPTMICAAGTHRVGRSCIADRLPAGDGDEGADGGAELTADADATLLPRHGQDCPVDSYGNVTLSPKAPDPI